MSYRLVPLLLAGVVFLAGMALADEPAGQDEPPVRLKKKKPKDGDKPAAEPGKGGDKKKDDKKKDAPKAEPREAEPVTPQEEAKEVLQRVINNVRGVEERLAKNDLGEATRQKQRDILNDIESLIRRNENPPPQEPQQPQSNDGGGGGADQNPMDNQDQENQKGKGGKQPGGGSNKSAPKSGKQPGGGGSQPGGGSKQVGKQRDSLQGTQKQTGGRKPADPQPGGRNGKGNKGGGGDKSDRARDRNADLNKFDTWGHVPQSLRAQMDAYSNPQSFLPKYDDLIKRYYRTIAEQGRRKGN